MSTTHVLVIPAPDCPADTAQVPPVKPRPTRANIEYDLLTAEPYALDHRGYACLVGDVGRDRQRFDAKLAYLVCRICRGRLIYFGDRHIGAFFGETCCDGRADASASAGHDRVLAFDFQVHQ